MWVSHKIAYFKGSRKDPEREHLGTDWETTGDMMLQKSTETRDGQSWTLKRDGERLG